MKRILLSLVIVLAFATQQTTAQESSKTTFESILISQVTLQAPTSFRYDNYWTANVTITMTNNTSGPLYLDPLKTFLLQDANGTTYAPRIYPGGISSDGIDFLDPFLIPFNPQIEKEIYLYVEIPYGPDFFRLVSADGSLSIDVLSQGVPTSPN